MKNIFIGFLVLNLLFEGLTGVLLVAGSLGAQADMPTDGMNWMMNYGFAALAVASAILWIWPDRSNRHAVGAVLGILLVFHLMLCASIAIQGGQLLYVAIHGAMAALALFLYVKRSAYTA